MACEIPCTSFIMEQDVIETLKQRQPTVEKDFQIAKLTMQMNGLYGDNMYVHMIEVIHRILFEKGLDERTLELFELLSQDVYRDRFRMEEFVLEPTYIEPERLELAVINMNSLTQNQPLEVTSEEQDFLNSLSDDKPLAYSLLQMQHHWNFIGIGLPYEEIQLLSNTLRMLQRLPIYRKCRFWGKMFATNGAYYIIEASLSDEEIDRRLTLSTIDGFEEREPFANATHRSIEEKDESVGEDEAGEKGSATDIFGQYPKLPTLPPLRRKPVVPPEPLGTGLNQKVYLVTSYPDKETQELPCVTPEDITISRQIRKFLTGDLNAPIISNPKFPGTEKNYMRALIARITAGTYISPMGYYLDEVEDEEVADAEDGPSYGKDLAEDENYNPPPISDLLQLNNWVHHREYILEQGRAKWTRVLEDHESADEEEEEEVLSESDDDGQAPEVGPEILTPIIDDIWADMSHAWSTRLMTTRDPSNTFVLVKSFVWPGAFAFAKGKITDCLYIGFGFKSVPRNYIPPKLPPILGQYPLGPEIMEAMDPGAALEEAWRLAHLPPPAPSVHSNEEEEEEEVGEGMDDDEENEY